MIRTSDLNNTFLNPFLGKEDSEFNDYLNRKSSILDEVRRLTKQKFPSIKHQKYVMTEVEDALQYEQDKFTIHR